MKRVWVVAIVAGLAILSCQWAIRADDALIYDMVAYQEEAEQAQAAATCDDCNRCLACATCASSVGCPGVIGGAEILFLDPHSSAGINADGLGAPYTEWNYRPAWRFWLGYQTAGGQGFRVRYFEFDQYNYDDLDRNNPEQGGALAASLDIDAWYIDIEYTDKVKLFGCWNGLLHGGVRHAELQRIDWYRTQEGESQTNYLTTSWGLTGGLEARRPLLWGWDLYTNLQASILFGDSDSYNLLGNVDAHLENGTQTILEIAFGTERNVELNNGAQFFSRYGVEAQYWDGFAREVDYEQGEAMGFFGFTIALGINR